MGHDSHDKVEDRKESKEAKSEALEQTSKDTYSKEAIAGLHDAKLGDYLQQKTNVDKVKIADKGEVALTPKEKETIKDAAAAMAKGDMDKVKEIFKGMKPEEAEKIAAGLDKALRPGVAVNYDKDSKALEFYTNPAKIGNTSSDKIMVPTNGDTPQKGKGDTFYSPEKSPQVNSDATSGDVKKVIDQAQKGYEAAKMKAGAL